MVCDGFVGNIVLKTCESLATSIFRWLRSELTKNPKRQLGALLAKGAFRTIKQRVDAEALVLRVLAAQVDDAADNVVNELGVGGAGDLVPAFLRVLADPVGVLLEDVLGDDRAHRVGVAEAERLARRRAA